MTSTIDARWAELAPGAVAPLAPQHTRLSSSPDVLRLIAQPHASEAYLIHAGRPRVTSTVTGRTTADHGLVIAVHDGRGYAEYAGARGDGDRVPRHSRAARQRPASSSTRDHR
ncbi:MAG: hypothetical protein ACRDRP_08885 [Pseudonocardiaceae bacterium]